MKTDTSCYPGNPPVACQLPAPLRTWPDLEEAFDLYPGDRWAWPKEELALEMTRRLELATGNRKDEIMACNCRWWHHPSCASNQLNCLWPRFRCSCDPLLLSWGADGWLIIDADGRADEFHPPQSTCGLEFAADRMDIPDLIRTTIDGEDVFFTQEGRRVLDPNVPWIEISINGEDFLADGIDAEISSRSVEKDALETILKQAGPNAGAIAELLREHADDLMRYHLETYAPSVGASPETSDE